MAAAAWSEICQTKKKNLKKNLERQSMTADDISKLKADSFCHVLQGNYDCWSKLKADSFCHVLQGNQSTSSHHQWQSCRIEVVWRDLFFLLFFGVVFFLSFFKDLFFALFFFFSFVNMLPVLTRLIRATGKDQQSLYHPLDCPTTTDHNFIIRYYTRFIEISN